MIPDRALRSLPCPAWALQSIGAAENLTWSFCQPTIEFAGAGFREPRGRARSVTPGRMDLGVIRAGADPERARNGGRSYRGRRPFVGTTGAKRIRSGCNKFEYGSDVARFTARYA